MGTAEGVLDRMVPHGYGNNCRDEKNVFELTNSGETRLKMLDIYILGCYTS